MSVIWTTNPSKIHHCFSKVHSVITIYAPKPDRIRRLWFSFEFAFHSAVAEDGWVNHRIFIKGKAFASDVGFLKVYRLGQGSLLGSYLSSRTDLH